MRLTTLEKWTLERGYEMEHAGGFYTADRNEHRRCERLRARGLLRFWNGRRSTFWSAQFYTLTDAGRRAYYDSRHR